MKIGGFPTLEPGDYILRFYRLEDEESALEERVRVVAGQTTEVNIDLSVMAEETEAEEATDEELDVESGDDATDEPADTIEAP
jgi:hypothetical protein